jgi:hypothetical protein
MWNFIQSIRNQLIVIILVLGFNVLTDNYISYVYEGTAEGVREDTAIELVDVMRGVRFNKNDYFEIIDSADFISKAEIYSNTKLYFLNNKPIEIVYGLRLLYSLISLIALFKIYKLLLKNEQK